MIMGVGVITKTPKGELKTPKDLSTVPMNLWSRTSTDVGLLISAQSVVIKTKGGPSLALKQYPIPKEAERSVQKQIVYVTRGLKECSSPYNTPIRPIKNKQTKNQNQNKTKPV